jgi:hypothetical protein
MVDPVILFNKDGVSRPIPAIDAPGWEAAGWSRQPKTVKSEVQKTETSLELSPEAEKSVKNNTSSSNANAELKETLEKLKKGTPDNPGSVK